jgi:nicotinate-nucleotide adenylyltransferase
MLQHAELDKIWFVVSPQNPFKENEELLNETERLKMAEMAIADNDFFETSSVEFNLPKPNYTVHTLNIISQTYPEHKFFPIIGGDNLQSFHLWKDFDIILAKYQLLVYKRLGYAENNPLVDLSNAKIFEVPFINISSTYIRNTIKEGKSIQYLVPQNVVKYISDKNLYQ